MAIGPVEYIELADRRARGVIIEVEFAAQQAELLG
jgi:hypothetical protein